MYLVTDCVKCMINFTDRHILIPYTDYSISNIRVVLGVVSRVMDVHHLRIVCKQSTYLFLSLQIRLCLQKKKSH